MGERVFFFLRLKHHGVQEMENLSSMKTESFEKHGSNSAWARVILMNLV